MGIIRNGARSWLRALADACRFSRMPGFRTGVYSILGADTNVTNLLNAWEAVCTIIDIMVATDNFYNQKDYREDDGPGEDSSPPA